MTPPRIETDPGVFRDLPDNVVDLTDQEACAWGSYSEKAAELIDNHRLLLDRAFNEELERRRQRWLKLFLINSGSER